MATFATLTIYNKALVLCGASPITGLSQDTANARSLNAVVDEARQGFLTECQWNFSVTRSTLATISTSTIAWLHPEEGYAYTRPSTALRIWRMSEISAIWREQSGIIIADCANLGALWTYDQTEYGLWQPKAITAFIDKLCSDICFMILNDATKANAFLEKYEDVSLPNAMAENSQTGTQQEVLDDAWLAAKLGGGRADRSYS